MTFSGSKTELECTLAEAGQDPRLQVRCVGAWVRAVHGPRTTVGNQELLHDGPAKAKWDRTASGRLPMCSTPCWPDTLCPETGEGPQDAAEP